MVPQWFHVVALPNLDRFVGEKGPMEGTFFFVRGTAKTKIVLKHTLPRWPIQPKLRKNLFSKTNLTIGLIFFLNWTFFIL